jgi:hypothetical protein
VDSGANSIIMDDHLVLKSMTLSSGPNFSDLKPSKWTLKINHNKMRIKRKKRKRKKRKNLSQINPPKIKPKKMP